MLSMRRTRGCDVANQLVGQYILGLTSGSIDLTFGYYIVTIVNMWKMHQEICIEKDGVLTIIYIFV